MTNNGPAALEADVGSQIFLERAQARPPYWRVFVGAILLAGRIGQFVSPGDNLIQPTDAAGRLGSYFGSAVVLAGAAWLVCPGFKRRTIRISKD